MNRDAIQLSVIASALGDDLRDAPRRARVMGFEGLQFDAYSTSLNIPELSASGRREFLRLLSAQDRKLVGLRFDAGQKGFGPGADADRLLDRLNRVLESAAVSGAPLVCVDAGPLPAPQVTAPPKPKIPPEQAGLILLPTTHVEPQPAPTPPARVDPSIYSTVDAVLAELGKLADRYSVIIAFRSDLSSLAAIERAIRSAACTWFGVDFDPVAVLRDEWDLDEAFSHLGGLIRHVRGHDAVAGADRRTKPAPIGAGSTDWNHLLANLESSDYRGWLTIDPTELSERTAAAERGRKKLESFAR